ncbi:dentin sialophosphoprotein [Flavobacteriaceae bacterium UJ101]|nr:dentin sialophosphoprotein [Flavobacteriaceae bacterium UJ101]
MRGFYILCLTFFSVIHIFSQVGVNTDNPTETLDVNGTLRVREIDNGTTLATRDSILVVSGKGIVQKVSAAAVVAEGGNSPGNVSVLTDGTVIVGSGTTNQEITLGQNGATTNQVLKWNGTSWVASDDLNTDNQTLTNLSLNSSNVLSISLEDGGTKTLDLSSLNNIGTDDQQLSLTGNSLSLEDGGTAIDLSGYLDNTDDQQLSLMGNSLSLEDGGTAIDLSSYLDNTDNQQLSLTGNSLALEDGGTAIDLSGYLDNTDNQTITDLSLNSSNVLSISIEDGGTETLDLSSLNNSGTDDQQLSLTGNSLALEDGGTAIDLSSYLDNTDNQTITDLSINSSNVLSISIEDGGTETLDLSSLNNSGTDDQQLSLTGNSLALEDGGTAIDLSGYLDNTDNQQLSLTGNSLSLEDGGTAIDLSGYLDNTDNQTITDLSINSSNVLSISIEDGGTETLDLSSLNNSGTDDQQLSLTGNSLALEDGGTAIDLSGYLDNTDNQTITDLSINSSNVLSISIEDGGTETLDLSSLNNSGTDDQQLSLTGNSLSLEDGGTAIDLSSYLDNTDNQTITDLSINSSNVLSISIEDGGTETLDLSSLNNSGTDDQQLSLTGNSLALEDGGTAIDLSGYLDNTDNQTITDLSINSSNVLSISIEDGGTETLDLSSLNNSGTDDQQLSLTGNSLSLEDGGTAIDLSSYLDNTDNQTITDLSINSSNVLSISIEDGGTETLDLSSLNNSGTDDQQLSLTGNSLALEDGGTAIDLSGYLDNTDNQQLSLTGNSLSLEDGGTAIDLSGYLDNTDNQTITDLSINSSNVLSISIEDGGTETLDLSSLNNSGTDDQQLSLTGNSLSLEDGGTAIDLSGYLDNTDNQTITDLSINSSNVLSISIEDGGTETLDLSSLNNSGTDDQQLSLTGNSLSLEDGGTAIDLSGYLDNTDNQTITDLSINSSNVLSISIEDGGTETLDLSSLNNSGTDDQQLSLTGNSLALEDGGTAIDLSGYLDNTDNQQLSLTGNSLSLEDGGTAIDLSGYLDNTDNQQLSLTGNSLSLEDGGTAIDLSGYLDNTDNQTITDLSINSSNVLSISIEDGGTETLDLSSLNNSGTDDQQLSLTGNNLALEDGGTAIDLSGYLDNTDNQQLSLTGNSLALEDGGTAIDLSSYLDNTDNQTITDLSINSSNVLSISIEDGGTETLDLSSLNNSGTDDQQLSLTGNSLALEDGGTAIDLSGYLDNTDNQTITDLSINSSNVLSISIEDGGTETLDLSSLNNSGTDDQQLSLTGNSLSLEDGGTAIDLSGYLDNTDNQTITDLSINSSNVLSISIEDGGTETLDLSSLNNSGTDDQQLSLTGNSLALEDGGTAIDLSGYLDNTDNQQLSLTGNSLALEDGGTAIDLSGYLDNTDNQQLSLTGNSLSLEDGGTAIDLSGYLDNTDNQTITNLSINSSNVLSISIEDGGTETLDLSSLNNSGTDDQQLSLTGNSLALEDGGTAIDLSGYLDNTDNQTITDLSINSSNVLSISIEDGGTETLDLSSLNNSGTDDQQLSLTGNSLALEDGGTAIDLSGYLDNTDNQQLSLTGNSLSLEDGGTAIDLSSYLDNTDNQTITDLSINSSNVLSISIEDGGTETLDLSSLNNSGTDDQQLSLTGNSLALEDGGTAIDLSGYLDNTDNQQLSLTGNSLSLEDGGTAIDLSSYLDNTDNQTITDLSLNSSNVLSISIEDGGTETLDLSSLNNSGTDDQQLSLTGNSLALEDGGTAIDLSGYLDNTDNQQLSLTGNSLALEDGGTAIDLSSYLDNTDNQTITDLSLNSSNVLSISIEDGGTETLDLSSLNNSGTDDQQLSLTGNSLALEDGGTAIDLSGYLDNTDNQQLSLTGNSLSLENGGAAIDLSSYLDNTDNQNLDSVLTQGNDASGNTIENLANPTNAQDAATKNYVDTAISALTDTKNEQSITYNTTDDKVQLLNDDNSENSSVSRSDIDKQSIDTFEISGNAVNLKIENATQESFNLSATTPTDGQTLTWNNTDSQWEAQSVFSQTTAEIYDVAGGQTLNESSFSDINFATTGIVDTSDYSSSSNSITISKTGRYEITYRVSTAVPTTVNNRTGGEFYLEVGGSESPGTRAYTYQRNRLIDKNTITVDKIIEVTSAPVVIKVKGKVYASSQNGTSATLETVANGSSLIIKRIK